jgi:O-antigen/teichoic acid export membrane protein
MSTSSDRTGPWRHVENVLSSWGSLVVSAVSGFFLAPFIVHGIGSDAYGAWALVGSFVGYLGMLELGVRGAVTRYVANYHSASRHRELNELTATALSFFALAGAASVAVGVGLAKWGLPIADMPDELLAEAQTAFVVTCMGVSISMLTGVFQAVIAGRQRFRLLNTVNIISTLVRAAAIVVGLNAGGGIVFLAEIQLATSGVLGIVMIFASRRVYPELRIRLAIWKGADARTLLSFGLVSWILQIASMLVHYSDPLVIAAQLPVLQITYFAIAASLVEYARQLVSGISHLIVPQVSSLQGSGRIGVAGEAALTGARFATLISLTLLVTFIGRGTSFVGLWMGPEFGSACGTVLVILACARWCSASFQVTSSALLGLGRHRGLIPAVVVEAIANIALSVWLSGPYGIVGVAIGTLIPRMAVTLVYAPWYMRSVTEVPIGQYWLQTLVRPSLAMVPFGVCTFWMEYAIPAEGLLIFFIQVAVSLPLALAGAWIAALDASEREMAIRAVRKVASNFLG